MKNKEKISAKADWGPRSQFLLARPSNQPHINQYYQMEPGDHSSIT